MKNHNEGFSLIGVLIGIALISILAALFANFSSQAAGMVRKLRLLNDIRELGDYVSKKVACDGYGGYGPTTCDGSQYVPLWTRDSSSACRVLAPKWPHRELLGDKFLLRATCRWSNSASTPEFNIEYAVSETAASDPLGAPAFSKDPLTKNPLTFKDLFGAPMQCPSGVIRIESGSQVLAWLQRMGHVPPGVITLNPGGDGGGANVSGFRLTSASLAKVCRILGYRSIVRVPAAGDGFSTCENNNLVYFDAGNNTWKQMPACDANSQLWEAYINEPLICGNSGSSCPLP